MSDAAALRKIIDGILEDNLRVRPDESVLFFTDTHSRWEENSEVMIERRNYLHLFYDAFRQRCETILDARHDKYTSTGRHGGEPRENIWRLAFGEEVYATLVDEDWLWQLREGAELDDSTWRTIRDLIASNRDRCVDTVVAFSWYSTTHTRFRGLLNEFGCRYASMPMLTESVLTGPMHADWGEVAKRTAAVYDILVDSKVLRLKCPSGTDLMLTAGTQATIHKDDGDLSGSGAIGNLPAGEAYLVPGTAKGVLTLTSAPQLAHIERTHVEIDDGRVVGFREDTPYARFLTEKFERDLEMRNIAELGVGTNRWAQDVSSMIEGEKIQGTVHIAIGTDAAMGGQVEASEHLDYIIVGPTLVAELGNGAEVTIVEQGRLVVGDR